MTKVARRAVLTALTVLVGAVTALLATVGAGVTATAAGISYDPDRFQAGNIISDALFFDGGAMTASEVQAFLDDKGSGCTAGAEACLKDYKVTEAARDATSTCKAIRAFSNESAASYIATVGEACGISQRVLLVTLQKEQGLVTATQPSSRRYEIAMGYGCPDTAACDEDYYGFANQVWRAANQFQRYATYATSYRFRAGGTYEIAYSPSGSCGTKSVTVENAATAALYNYTPYTPNDAALEAWPGTASCGAYGNRNFFAYWSLWFGNSTIDTSLYKIAGQSSIWVVEGDKRWRIHGNDPELQATVSVWGDVAEVSSQYLSTFDAAGDFTGIMESPQGYYFVVDNGRRFTVRTCEDLEELGFACTSSVSLGWDLVRAFTVAGDMPNVLQASDGTLYWLSDGAKHEVLDNASAKAAGLTVSGVTLTRASVLSGHALGAPVIAEGSLYRGEGLSEIYYESADGPIAILWKDQHTIPIVTWFGGTDGTLSAASVSANGAAVTLPGAFVGPDGVRYLLTSNGLAKIPWGSTWLPSGLTTMPADLIADLPGSWWLSKDSGIVTTRYGANYWIEDGVAKPIPNPDGPRLFAAAYGAKSFTVLDSYISMLGTGNTALAPGSVVRTQGSGPKYLIDASGMKHPISWQVLRETTLVPVYDFSSATALDGYKTGSTITLGLKCGDEYWLQFDGVIHQMTSAAVKAYGSALEYTELDSATCLALDDHAKNVSPLLRVWGSYWLVENGTAHTITVKEYREYRKIYEPAKAASTALMRELGVVD